jgi:hypothetical protein
MEREKSLHRMRHHVCMVAYTRSMAASAKHTWHITPVNSDAGHAVCTTIAENGPLMAELFGARPAPFKPCIPNLVNRELLSAAGVD